MGLFDKKFCDVCGERIRFLGNRKLEDGNLCKSCESLLSPWFSDRRRSTVADIKAQIADRQQNQARVAAFTATRTLGEGSRLCIDEQKGQFMVLRPGEGPSDNPDVLELSQIMSCEVEVDDSKTEEKTKNEEGKLVSYDPPRYTYSYRLYLKILVNHPWFDEMRFRINRNPVEIQTGTPIQMPGLLSAIKTYVPDKPEPEKNAEYQKYLALGEEMRGALLGVNRQPVQEGPAQPEPESAAVPEGSPAAEAPQKIACPACTAVVYPDEKGCCPYCGTKLG